MVASNGCNIRRKSEVFYGLVNINISFQHGINLYLTDYFRIIQWSLKLFEIFPRHNVLNIYFIAIFCGSVKFLTILFMCFTFCTSLIRRSRVWKYFLHKLCSHLITNLHWSQFQKNCNMRFYQCLSFSKILLGFLVHYFYANVFLC